MLPDNRVQSHGFTLKKKETLIIIIKIKEHMKIKQQKSSNLLIFWRHFVFSLNSDLHKITYCCCYNFIRKLKDVQK